jgi:hypothetical protein
MLCNALGAGPRLSDGLGKPSGRSERRQVDALLNAVWPFSYCVAALREIPTTRAATYCPADGQYCLRIQISTQVAS